MQYADKLISHGRKTITKAELKKLFSTPDDEQLFSIISLLESQAILSPVKTSKTNGNFHFPIYDRYHITLPSAEYTSELSEISKLHPALQAGGYLQRKPEAYRKYRKQFQLLDQYLFMRKNNDIPISKKERSFDIFSEEKTLDDVTFRGLLEKLGLTVDKLSYYETPEYCFNDYIPHKKDQMTLLICENKDIWFNLRRVMFEDGCSVLFGIPLDGVIYGSGNKISAQHALTAYTNFMGGANVQYLYWGDIDRAGLNIYFSLLRANPSLNISLFTSAYEKMLQLSLTRNIPNSEDHREIMEDYTPILEVIAPTWRESLKTIICDNKRIPQEIISYAFLKENMR